MTAARVAGQPVRADRVDAAQRRHVLRGHRLDRVEQRQAPVHPLRLKAVKRLLGAEPVGNGLEIQHIASGPVHAKQRLAAGPPAGDFNQWRPAFRLAVVGQVLRLAMPVEGGVGAADWRGRCRHGQTAR